MDFMDYEREPEEDISIICGRDKRYPARAYYFLLDVFDYASDGEGYVSPDEFMEGFQKLAILNFGFMSKLVLNRWGIRGSGDIGEAVWNLVEAGLLKKSKGDDKSGFEDRFDFEEVFSEENTFRPVEDFDNFGENINS